MRAGEAERLLDVLGERQEYHGMSVDYFAGLHSEYGTEMDLLVGKGALERPYGQKQLTAAEQFYTDKYGAMSSQDFMEVNRTTMNLWLLDKVLEGDEQSFADCQPGPVKLVGEPFQRLKSFVEATLPTEELRHTARVTLMIADMGKSKKVAERMHELTGQSYADHDRLLVDVLEHPEAAAEMMPAFMTLSESLRGRVVETLKTGFHLPQFMQAENLPSNLVPFQKLDQVWQDFSNLVSIFDIGGAAGDTVQNGSITLNRNTFASFEQAIAAIKSRPHDIDAAADPKLCATHSYNMYLDSLGSQFGLDISVPEDRALARLARMGRAHAGSADQIAELRDVLENHLGEGTKATLLQYLNYTGFEEGALWQEYAPALPNEALKSMTKAGVDRKSALVSALTNIARIDVETRAQLDMTDADGPLNVVIGDVVRAAEEHPQLLLNGKLKITRINKHEATATLIPVPDLDLKDMPLITSLEELYGLDVWRPNETMYVGFGGGADPVSSAVVAKLFADHEAPIVSVWGSRNITPSNAEQLSDTVFLSTPETNIPGMRNFEGEVAAMGLRSYLIVQERPFRTIEDDLQVVADHAGSIRRLVGVDTGGDVLEQIRPEDAQNSRDHLTLQGLANAGEALNVASNISCVLAPGIDSPENVLDVLKTARARRYDLRSHGQMIIDLCASRGLPSGDPRRYSTTLPIFLKALAGNKGLEELPLPKQEILRVSRPWVPLRIIQPSMAQALFMTNDAHVQAVGL